MAPKKAAVSAADPYRDASPYTRIAIVGLPNVGKSTLFNLVTNATTRCEKSKYSTTETFSKIVEIPNCEFDYLCQLLKTSNKVPGFLEIIDTPGLVRGAYAGEGLGNDFLREIHGVDGMFHVLRAFKDDEILHVDETVNIARDLECTQMELQFKDIEFIDNRIEELQRSDNEYDKAELKLCLKALFHLREGKDICLGDWEDDKNGIIDSYDLLTNKPKVYLVNYNSKNLKEEGFRECIIDMMNKWVCAHDDPQKTRIMSVNCAKEQDLRNKKADGHFNSQIPRIIAAGAGFRVHFYTTSPDVVRCWQVRKQASTLSQAARVVDRRYGRGYISAKVIKVKDLQELGSLTAVMGAAKYKQRQEKYNVEDGDIIVFDLYNKG